MSAGLRACAAVSLASAAEACGHVTFSVPQKFLQFSPKLAAEIICHR